MVAYRVGWIGTESCRYLMNNVVVEMRDKYKIDIVIGKSPSRTDPLFGPQDAHMVFFKPHWGQRADPRGSGYVYMDEARSMINKENQLFVVTCLHAGHLDSLIQRGTRWLSSLGTVVTLGDIVDPEFTSGNKEYHADFKHLVEQNLPEKCIPWICEALKNAIEKSPNVAVSRIQQRVDIYWPRYITEYQDMPIDLLPLLVETGWALQGLGIQCVRYDKDPPPEASSGIAVHCFRHAKGRGLMTEQTLHPPLNIPTLMVPLVHQDFRPSPGHADTDPPQDTAKYYWMPMAVREMDRLRAVKQLVAYDDAVKGLVTAIAKLVTKGALSAFASSRNASVVQPRVNVKEVSPLVEVKEPVIDLRFFVSDNNNLTNTAAMLNKLMGGKATAYPLPDDFIKEKNIKFPERVRVLYITNKKM